MKNENWKPGEANLLDPMKWRKPRRVWVDPNLFNPQASDEHRDKVHAVMALCKQHTFVVATPFTEKMAEYLTARSSDDDGNPAGNRARVGIQEVLDDWQHGNNDALNLMNVWSEDVGLLPARHLPDFIELPLPNVILGALASNQAELDARVPHILRCPAARRCMVLDPLEGAVDLEMCEKVSFEDSIGGPRETWSNEIPDGIHWLVISGGDAPLDVAWVRSLIAQCKSAGVPVLVKGLGKRPFAIERTSTPHIVKRATRFNYTSDMPLRSRDGSDPSEWSEDIRVQEYPDANTEGGAK